MLFLLSSVVMMVTLIVLACCPDVRRQFPINFVVLVAFVSICPNC